MNRVLVALLCALDAALQAAVGLAAIAAPLTLIWVFGSGGAADWGALWPATAAIWQLGHLVAQQITLPDELIVAGISPDAAGFVLSLAPLAVALASAVFGARSGARAARSGSWPSGLGAAAVVSTAASALVAVTSLNPVAQPVLWQAIVFPAAVYVAGVLLGALVIAWRDGDDGIVDHLRGVLDRRADPWPELPGIVARAGAISVLGLVGLGAVGLAVAVFASGADIIALYQAGNVDALGAGVLTLAQLAYVPTLVVWALAWVSGVGFWLGEGAPVSPAGTEAGLVPGIPVLGALPEVSSPWLLLVALLPVGVGAFAGWVARSDLAAILVVPRAPRDSGRTHGTSGDPWGPRIAAALAIPAVTAAAAAGLAAAAHGAMGPGRLAEVGPHPGAVALAVGVEVLIGCAILLLSPRAMTARPAAPERPAEHAAPH